MHIRKTSSVLLIFILNVIFLTAFAGDNSHAAHKFFYRGVYIEANAGYAEIDWDHFAPAATFNIIRGGMGGFAFDIDSGYQYNRYLGFEVGWYNLPDVKYMTATNVNFTVQSWLLYLSIKLMLPIYKQLYLFTKAGGSYRCVDFIASPPNVPPDGYNFSWQPTFAIGGQVYFNPSWFLTLQYMYVPSHTSTTLNNSAFLVPRTNLITVSLAYKFEV